MQKDPECYNQKKSFQGGGRLLERLKRIIAVVGHYGSGKTNLAVNLAADLAASGRDVALADLDIVNPYFRSADFTAQMQAKGVEMIVPPYARSNLDIPALPARMDGAIDGGKTLVLDIGGDDAGAAALGRYTPSGMRQRVVEHGGYTVVEDCYNASPDSMAAALATLGGWACGGRRVAVLADMLELGPIAREAHRQVGRLAAENGVDLLLCYGPLARGYAEGAAGVEAICFDDKAALTEELRRRLRPGDVVWVKGSHGMALEEVLQGLYTA